jgi:glycosyltransferase involved in cell wall biosynthesis
VLLSNIAHYHHLAAALHSKGYLSRYIAAPALLDGEAAPRLLPSHMRAKFEGRRLHGVPRSKVSQIHLAEVCQRLAPALPFISRERGDWINNHLFDALALPRMMACDVFHFVSSVGLYCARKAKKSGAIIVCDVRQEHPEFQRKILKEEAENQKVPVRITGNTYEDRVLREFELADLIVTPSLHAKRSFLSQGFSESKIAVLPYGVDLDVFRPDTRVLPKPGVLHVLYAGSLTIRKGPQYLLEAVQSMGSRVELTLVGPLDPAFKQILAKYEGHFRFLGAVSKIELQQLYAATSVFVLPSLADSFSLATLESMACGVPVIVSENTGAADIVEEGQNGWIVPIRSARAIRDRLQWFLDHPEKRAEMGVNAASRAREMTWERYGEGALRMYAKLGQSLRVAT